LTGDAPNLRAPRDPWQRGWSEVADDRVRQRLAAVRERHRVLARRYDDRWRRYIQETGEATLAAVGPVGSGRLLDLGCGTGSLLRDLDGLDGPRAPLWGIDLSLEMLRRAKEACPSCDMFVVGDVAHLPFCDGSFDIVLSSSSLHNWADPARALREAHRVSRPGARLVLTDWCRNVWGFLPLAAYLRLFDTTVEHVYSVEELEDLLNSTGFLVQRSKVYRVARYWGMMTVTSVRPE
jgi:ubiquinone/menaquinone biosynthesis C-methylase UbiE